MPLKSTSRKTRLCLEQWMAMDRTVSVATLTDKRGDACKRVGIFVFAAGWFGANCPTVRIAACKHGWITRIQHARLHCASLWCQSACLHHTSGAQHKLSPSNDFCRMTIKGTFTPIWLADMTQCVDCTAFLCRSLCVWLCKKAAAHAVGQPHGR